MYVQREREREVTQRRNIAVLNNGGKNNEKTTSLPREKNVYDISIPTP